MTELHLDSDEWAAILDALMSHRDATTDLQYREFLSSVATKVEMALLVTEME